MKKICALFTLAIVGLTAISGCDAGRNSSTESDRIINFNQSDSDSTSGAEESTETSVGCTSEPETHPEAPIDNISYKINEDEKSVTVTGHQNPIGEICIPETIDDYVVTAIDDHAFYKTELTEIILPETIESIGSAAFYGCFGLESISFPSSLISIGSFAFAECTSLKSIDIPVSTQNIDSFAFINCTNLSDITIDIKNTFDKTAFLSCPGSPIEYDGYFKDASLNWLETEIIDGYTYSDWVTTSSFESETPVETTVDDTTRTVSNGYYFKFDEENNSKIMYKYIVQNRDKEPKFKTVYITTYNYTISVEEDGEIVDKVYYNQSYIPSDQ